MTAPLQLSVPSTLTLVQDISGVSGWRVAWPAAALKQLGFPVAWGMNQSEEAAQQIAAAQLVVLQRSCWMAGDEPRACAFRDWLHDSGRLLGYETDDDLYSPEVIERIRATGDDKIAAKSDLQLEEGRQARLFALGLADGVTVSTPGLARVVQQYTDRPVLVVPNAIDLPRFQAGLGPRESGRPVTIGWLGGNRPDRDVERTGLAVAWARIARRFPDVQFLVGGYPLGALLRAVPSSRCVYLDKQPLTSYAWGYGQVDILCCPLADEVFNRAKSPIKALEGAAAGCAVVASPTVYGDLLISGDDGLVADGADAWEASLVWLLRHPELRRHMARRLAQRVEREHSLAATVTQWPLAWALLAADAGTRGFGPAAPVTPAEGADRDDRRAPAVLAASAHQVRGGPQHVG